MALLPSKSPLFARFSGLKSPCEAALDESSKMLIGTDFFSNSEGRTDQERKWFELALRRAIGGRAALADTMSTGA
jgi:hypothetical protein